MSIIHAHTAYSAVKPQKILKGEEVERKILDAIIVTKENVEEIAKETGIQRIKHLAEK